MNKKGLGWFGWTLIAIVLIAAGVGIYFWLTGGDIGSVISGGSSVPQPPALPV